MLSRAHPSLNSLMSCSASLVLRLRSFIVHSMSCIYDLNTRSAPDEVPPLNFCILGLQVLLNSDANRVL